MSKLHDILNHSKKYLSKYSIQDDGFCAESIIASVLKCKRLDIYLQHDRIITEKELKKIERLIERRRLNEPLQYILGSVEFYNCHLKVNNKVLIPRFETEQLVDLIIKNLKMETEKKSKSFNTSFKRNKIWDLCTGSGCIAIALKKTFPNFDITASDISSSALQVAKDNASANGCEVDFKLGDLLEPFKDERGDVIICNPPYVSEKEFESLPKEVKDFEPKKALIAEEEGISFYKKLSLLLPHFLNKGGKVFFEIGESQKNLLEDLFVDERWVLKKIYKDFSGKDRFFFLEIE